MVIMKQTTQKGEPLGFITVPKDYDGKDLSKVANHRNLTAARNYLMDNWSCTIGQPKNPDAVKHKQKMRDYPQNKPGFNAESHNSKR